MVALVLWVRGRLDARIHHFRGHLGRGWSDAYGRACVYFNAVLLGYFQEVLDEGGLLDQKVLLVLDCLLQLDDEWVL
jgi:hypothetical protein